MCRPTGDVPEETYHAQQKLQVDMLDLFRMVDQAANRALTGALPRREIQVLLKGDAPKHTARQTEQSGERRNEFPAKSGCGRLSCQNAT